MKWILVIPLQISCNIFWKQLQHQVVLQLKKKIKEVQNVIWKKDSVFLKFGRTGS